MTGRPGVKVLDVSVIRIEPEDPIKTAPCQRCMGTSRLIHGYVHEDERPRGLYFLEWCDGEHPVDAAFLTIGLGDFGEDSSASGRRSVCIEWRREGMRLADQPARDRPELLGAFQPREAALTMPSIDLLWHVADHIVLGDRRIALVEEWLKR
jgi:hypothetical protein